MQIPACLLLFWIKPPAKMPLAAPAPQLLQAKYFALQQSVISGPPTSVILCHQTKQK
jgi:hypothetical protein